MKNLEGKRMVFDESKIKMSHNDVRRGLTLPKRMTAALAEDIGIMVGDGHVGVHKRKTSMNYQICVSGDTTNDSKYIREYVLNLKKQLYNLQFPIHLTGKKKTEIRLQIYSKGLLEYYRDVIRLPVGRKDEIRVPEIIRKGTKEVKRAFLRGIFDTDGHFYLRKRGSNPYPRLKIVASSKRLIEDVAKILEELNLGPTTAYNLWSVHSKTGKKSCCHEVYLNGSTRLNKWIHSIGFSNLKNKLKSKIENEIISGPSAI
jgi:intein/homing endonuclease